jgi:hypothetical protein
MLNLLFVGMAILSIKYLKQLRNDTGPSGLITFGIVINWISGLINTVAVALNVNEYLLSVTGASI